MTIKNRVPVITLRNITKHFPLTNGRTSLIKTLISKSHTAFMALKNISLTIYKGERVGIVGPNGAGKTTLLRIISGASTPDSGDVYVIGKVISLIELGVGFHQDLSGKENIILNGLILGMNKKEIQHELHNIITFADIGRFISEPIYTYSLGMKLRLAFSIAVYAHPDILLLDEAIGVGDAAFRKKCDKKIYELSKQGVTIIVVTHWIELLKHYCEKIIWIEKGKIIKQGGLEMISHAKTN